MPFRIQENAPLPQCSTLTPMIVAAGAIPTVPRLLPGAATMPATCVPCQNVSALSHTIWGSLDLRSAESVLNGRNVPGFEGSGTNERERATSSSGAMSMCVLRMPPSRIATRTPAPFAPASQAAGADIASGTHCARRNVSAEPNAAAGTTSPPDSASPASTTFSGWTHCTIGSSSTLAIPLILPARLAKLGSADVATATPICVMLVEREPPALATWADRSAGRSFPVKSRMYDLASGAASCSDGLFATFAAVIGVSVGVTGASYTHAAATIAPAIVAVRTTKVRICELLNRCDGAGSRDSQSLPPFSPPCNLPRVF